MSDKLKQTRELMKKAYEDRLNVAQQLKVQFEKQILEIDSIEDPYLKMNALEMASKVFKALY